MLVIEVVGAAPCATAPAADVPLHRGTVVSFATVEQGSAALTRRDRFIASQSRFDRQARLKTDREVTEDDLLKFVAGEVVAWNEDDVAKVTAALESVGKRLEQFAVPLPETVLLVQTTGKEDGDAAYCRGNAVVLPRRIVASPVPELERLLIHELFHVVSSHNPALRKRLYATIGFQVCDEIALPKSLANRKMTNPDAPVVDCYIELNVAGRPVQFAPVLYASEENYNPQSGKSFFQYLLFRLLVIQADGDRWRVVEQEGRAVVVDPQKLPAYFERIGRNTNYVIHPDEILADNFMHLVLGAKSLPTPRIVEALGQEFAK